MWFVFWSTGHKTTPYTINNGGGCDRCNGRYDLLIKDVFTVKLFYFIPIFWWTTYYLVCSDCDAKKKIDSDYALQLIDGARPINEINDSYSATPRGKEALRVATLIVTILSLILFIVLDINTIPYGRVVDIISFFIAIAAYILLIVALASAKIKDKLLMISLLLFAAERLAYFIYYITQGDLTFNFLIGYLSTIAAYILLAILAVKCFSPSGAGAFKLPGVIIAALLYGVDVVLTEINLIRFAVESGADVFLSIFTYLLSYAIFLLICFFLLSVKVNAPLVKEEVAGGDQLPFGDFSSYENDNADQNSEE